MNDEIMNLEHNEGINRFIQLTYMTLCSSGPIPLQRLESTYKGMECSIHELASTDTFDIVAFQYVCSRLPLCIFSTRNILFGQSESFLEERGVPMSAWSEVYAKARRRRYLFDGHDTLIAFLASKSDLDDVIPSLLALQIEWNKCHRLLRKAGFSCPRQLHLTSETMSDLATQFAQAVGITEQQGAKLLGLFGNSFPAVLEALSTRQCDLYVQNYEASYCRYRKETETWWKHIQEKCPDIERRPIYFVSSNTHSLINVLSGFAEQNETEILAFAQSRADLAHMAALYHDKEIPARRKQNILYYLLMKYESSAANGAQVTQRRIAYEKQVGIIRIASTKTLDVPTQIIDLKKLMKETNRRQTGINLPKCIQDTDAMILNIDYPLGRTAYFILNKITEHVEKILGIYVIGKAASLFADRGDILIPSFIFDQHTRNQYYFTNCINAEDVTPFMDTMVHGVYDNQKAVTVLGTFLQNRRMLNDLLLAGITDLEMEAGPYLAAIYELTHPKRYPENETITTNNNGLDIGIVHYVSDNPLSEHRLDTSLEIDGIDGTYASTRAVLRKIVMSLINNAETDDRTEEDRRDYDLFPSFHEDTGRRQGGERT